MDPTDQSSFVVSDSLRGPLLTMRGSTVARVGLGIWPDGRAPEETDVRLYVELRGPDGQTRAIEFGTGADGQTPTIEISAKATEGSPLTVLNDRYKEWQKPQFWTSRETVQTELFFVSPDDDNRLHRVLGQRLVNADLVCFAGELDAVTGIRLEFGEAIHIWSFAGAYGNVVSTEKPTNWPAPIVLQPVW